jgi:hypothetical protein
MKRARLLAAIAMTAAALVVSACATVKPWQRAQLADPCMTFAPDGSLVAYQAHWQEAREGSSGGLGVQAGGCGCK